MGAQRESVQAMDARGGETEARGCALAGMPCCQMRSRGACTSRAAARRALAVCSDCTAVVAACMRGHTRGEQSRDDCRDCASASEGKGGCLQVRTAVQRHAARPPSPAHQPTARPPTLPPARLRMDWHPAAGASIAGWGGVGRLGGATASPAGTSAARHGRPSPRGARRPPQRLGRAVSWPWGAPPQRAAWAPLPVRRREVTRPQCCGGGQGGQRLRTV